jgi:hypothetical protein
MHIGGIFSDLAKASDWVNHNIAVSKLTFMELKVKLANGLNYILISENKELKLNLLIQILTYIPTGALFNIKFLKVEYMILFFSSYISMIYPK